MYARSTVVPEHYQGKADNCFIACQMAQRLKCDPMAYMQASYIVHKKPGIEAKLATALLNTSGKIKGRLRYKFEGVPGKDDRQCTAFAIDAESGDEVSATVTWAMVKAEGWLGKSGSKWQTMPDVMFQYRAATFLIRLYYSEVLMGMSTVDELEDAGPPATATNGATRTLSDMTARLEGKAVADGEAVEDAEEATATTGEQQARDESSQEEEACDYDAPYATIQSIGVVNEKEAEINALDDPTIDRQKNKEAAERRREAIRASRGERSNAK